MTICLIFLDSYILQRMEISFAECANLISSPDSPITAFLYHQDVSQIFRLKVHELYFVNDGPLAFREDVEIIYYIVVLVLFKLLVIKLY